MAKKRILLLNPPGDKLYIRDYYCSKISKAGYLYEPMDLMMLSGILAERHEIFLCDAIAEHLSVSKCLDFIQSLQVDVIIMLTGSVSLSFDLKFLAKLRAQCNCLILGSGDVLMEDGQIFCRTSALIGKNGYDAVILDFTSSKILDYLDGVYENSAAVLCQPLQKEEKIQPEHGLFQIPIPQHQLFNHKLYRYPFVKGYPFATMLTDYGCPFQCTFCIMSTLPYKYRATEDVMAEIKFLKTLGISEIYLDDQTFAALRWRAEEFCARLVAEKLQIGWVCFTRADLMDHALLSLMRKAGCHTVMYGVESGSNKILNSAKKNMPTEVIQEAFKKSKEVGLTTVGTFIIGLPDDDRESILATIEFAKSLECDYASFNIAIPRMRTPLRVTALAENLLVSKEQDMDQSGSEPVLATRFLTAKEVLQLKNQAVKDFYLRPKVLWRMLKQISSCRDLKRHLGGGLSILRNTINSSSH